MSDEKPLVERLRWEAGEWADDEPVCKLLNEAADEIERRKPYPFPDGDFVVLGPQTILSPDESVINWRGEHYQRQVHGA